MSERDQTLFFYILLTASTTIYYMPNNFVGFEKRFENVFKLYGWLAFEVSWREEIIDLLDKMNHYKWIFLIKLKCILVVA